MQECQNADLHNDCGQEQLANGNCDANPERYTKKTRVAFGQSLLIKNIFFHSYAHHVVSGDS